MTIFETMYVHVGLLQWLSGKESTCNAGDTGSIPGSGRSPGEGKESDTTERLSTCPRRCFCGSWMYGSSARYGILGVQPLLAAVHKYYLTVSQPRVMTNETSTLLRISSCGKFLIL